MVYENWRSFKMNFNNCCYEILKKVPKGKVTTYKAIANQIKTKAYRAVGTAMNKNPHDTNLVPCHRVIKSSGLVGKYASGTENKIKILRKEGIFIVNGKINLKVYEHKFNQK
jgi:methylated-DNA-[protein]-cysteine S-methyltransferase